MKQLNFLQLTRCLAFFKEQRNVVFMYFPVIPPIGYSLSFYSHFFNYSVKIYMILRALFILFITPKVSDSPMESVDNSVSGPAYQFTWPILNRHETVVCKQSNDIDLYFITFPDDVGSSRRNYHWLIFTVITSWYNQIKLFSYLLIFFVFRFSYAQVVTDNLKSLRAIQQAILVRVQTFTA